jgi:diketogulonate reductase-like aldo/keto reductase
MDDQPISRRTMLQALGGGIVAVSFLPLSATAKSLTSKPSSDLITKPIPSSGEKLPVIGMGTWQTFNVGADKELREQRTKVLAAFFNGGGSVIDSSPMYGSSQDVLGYGLDKLGAEDRVFEADKVWTRDGDETISQIVESRKKWDIAKFDLMQVHNLLAWQDHLPKLQELKKDNKIRYVGITTSHGRRHDEFEKIMKTQDLDFVQLTYNMADRDVEKRLLPLAAERDIAVIANRPFRGGSLIDQVQAGHSLPKWASEIGCENWPQFLLKFIVSHPAVTCAIPATTKVEHMRENMGAARGELPDAKTRKRMISYVASL